MSCFLFAFKTSNFVALLGGRERGGGGGGGGEGDWGILIIFLGGSVLPGPENPYPISDQNILFSYPIYRDAQTVPMFFVLCNVHSHMLLVYLFIFIGMHFHIFVGKFLIQLHSVYASLLKLVQPLRS